MRSATLFTHEAVAVLAVTSTEALARDVNVPSDRPTIAAALDNADAGDRIIVTGGRHRAVSSFTDGVTLVGRGATIVGETRINANGVTITGFRFGDESEVTSTGSDFVFTRNKLGRGSDVRAWSSDRSRFERNRFSPGLRVNEGVDVVVRNNAMRRASGMYVAGAGALVSGNHEGAHGCGIVVETGATGTTVDGCTITDCGLGVVNASTGMTLTGTAITGNLGADVLNLGAFDVFERNIFDTMSHDALLAPHR